MAVFEMENNIISSLLRINLATVKHTAKVVSMIALASITIIGLSQQAHSQSCTKLCDRDFWINSDAAEIISLIQSEGDINVTDNRGSSPLHLAAGFTDNPSVITALINAGAYPDARSEYDWTPLLVAAKNNENALVVKALLDAGTDLGARTDGGLSPLHVAASSNNNPLVVKALLDHGARNNLGLTSMHVAAYNKNPMVVRALIDAGADVQKQEHHSGIFRMIQS